MTVQQNVYFSRDAIFFVASHGCIGTRPVSSVTDSVVHLLFNLSHNVWGLIYFYYNGWGYTMQPHM